ncbi:MAG: carbohydrate kinase family protein, partial [Gammaproteobacteria bacterium]|nr:carbohydrate kinase family protein [Gammaproteobacteria bacterium]
HRCVRMIEGTFTSQAFITTDMDDNRITAFHPGAMNYSHLNEIPSVPEVDIGVIAADGREGMIEHAEQFAAADIRFIFDPGQGLTTLARDELRRLLDLATWVTVDDYEWLLLRERVGYTEQEVMDRVAALIVTRGGEGACIHVQPDTTIRIPAAKVWEIVDPSGCGDAFRAGLLFGLTNGMDWDTIGRIASLMGAIKIEHYGSQNHRFEWSEFAQRFKKEFGYELG